MCTTITTRLQEVTEHAGHSVKVWWKPTKDNKAQNDLFISHITFFQHFEQYIQIIPNDKIDLMNATWTWISSIKMDRWINHLKIMNSFKLLLKPTLAHDKTLNFLLLCQTAATVLSAGLVVLTQQHPAAQSTVTTIPPTVCKCGNVSRQPRENIWLHSRLFNTF